MVCPIPYGDRNNFHMFVSMRKRLISITSFSGVRCIWFCSETGSSFTGCVSCAAVQYDHYATRIVNHDTVMYTSSRELPRMRSSGS